MLGENKQTNTKNLPIPSTEDLCLSTEYKEKTDSQKKVVNPKYESSASPYDMKKIKCDTQSQIVDVNSLVRLEKKY